MFQSFRDQVPKCTNSKTRRRQERPPPVIFGQNADTTLRRAGPGALATDGSMEISGELSVGGNFNVNRSTTTEVFDFTGEDETFYIPDGVTKLSIKMWGAGGGSHGSYCPWSSRRASARPLIGRIWVRTRVRSLDR